MLNPNTLSNFIEPTSPLPTMDTLRRAASPVIALSTAALVLSSCTGGEIDPSPVCTQITVQLQPDSKTGVFRIGGVNENTPDWKAEKYEFTFGDGSSDSEEGRLDDQDGEPGAEDHKYTQQRDNKTYTVGAVIVMDALRENKWVQDGQRLTCPNAKITIPGTHAVPASSAVVVAPTTVSSPSEAPNKRPAATTTTTTTTTRKR